MASQDDRDYEEQIDPRLFKMLRQLRPTPSRDPEAEERGRARFLAEIETLSLPSRSRSPLARLARRLRSSRNHTVFNAHAKENEMNTPKARFAFTAVMVLIVIMAFLFGGSAITAMAAQSALPGDALYPVKMTIEQTRISLSRSAADRAQLQLEFAERRLGEIEGLIAEGRFQQVSTATVDYETYIKNALTELDLISEMDPARATELMLQITQSLARYAQTLTGMMSNVPDPVRAEMMRSIESIQDVSGQENLPGEIEFTGIVESIDGDIWVVDGRTVRVMLQTLSQEQIQVRDQVRIRAYQEEDGMLHVREMVRIRAGNDNANQNENGNDNSNANDNFNGNGNTNQNENQNQNQIQNGNDNDDGNGNMNQNQNGDDDDDEDGNGNTNQNQNQIQNDNDDDDLDDGDDDDNGNMNGNTNTNENQNGNEDDGNGNMNQNQNGNDDDEDDDGNINGDSNGNENQNQNGSDDDDDDD